MLVLTRKENEKIRIGSDIIIKIIDISDNQIKIGIEAPREVTILREEVYERVKQFTIEASQKSHIDINLNELKLNKINK